MIHELAKAGTNSDLERLIAITFDPSSNNDCLTRLSNGLFYWSERVLKRSRVRAQLQLDLDLQYNRQKINLPTNQKGCDNSETTVEKLSARRIQIYLVYFCKNYSCLLNF